MCGFLSFNFETGFLTNFIHCLGDSQSTNTEKLIQRFFSSKICRRYTQRVSLHARSAATMRSESLRLSHLVSLATSLSLSLFIHPLHSNDFHAFDAPILCFSQFHISLHSSQFQIFIFYKFKQILFAKTVIKPKCYNLLGDTPYSMTERNGPAILLTLRCLQFIVHSKLLYIKAYR